MSQVYRIGVFASPNGWHYRDLVRAVEKHDLQIDLFSLDFTALYSGIDSQQALSVVTNSMELTELDFILVRIMPTGTLEQIVLRMDILNRLQAANVRIVNAPRAVEIAVDKYLSLSILSSVGIPVPKTFALQTADDALRCFEELGPHTVMKPLFGSLGNGVTRFENPKDAQGAFERCVENGEVVYLQRFIDHGGVDYRFFVIGDKVWSIKRTAAPGQWVTNVNQGGLPVAHKATPKQIELAIRAARATNCEIAGVDVAYDCASGEPFVLEVNAAPGWHAISSTLDVDFAAEVLRHCVN